MPLDFSALNDAPRLLMQVELKPLQGTRFQPTGFPNLGPAEYDGPDGAKMLLVESAQSMANRMEAASWDEKENDWVVPLKGLPVVKVLDKEGAPLTNSVIEAHRLNSEYIARAKGFNVIAEAIGFRKDRIFDVRKQLVPALLMFDPNSLIHGTFLEEIGGVIRLPRVLSAFIEAEQINRATSGGVKFNRVQPEIKGGEGNVPYSRDEYTGKITAYFNVDLAQIRAFDLGAPVEELLIALALFKIQKFLATGLRLRTACDLAVDGKVAVTQPAGFTPPDLPDLEKHLPDLISGVRKEGKFGNDPSGVTVVRYEK